MSHLETEALAATGKRAAVFYWLNTAIVLFFFFGFGFIPPLGSLETIGMQILGIFIGLLYGWTCIGFVWPSILGAVALGLTGYMTIGKVIMTGLGDNITSLVLFLFVFAAFLDKVGLSSAIANWFVSRKIAVGRPWVFASLILLATYVISALVSQFAAILLLWSIFYKICEVVGYKSGDKYPTLIIIGIVFSSMLGVSVFPFKALSAMLIGSLGNATGLQVDFFAFTASTIIISLAILFGYVALCKFVFRPDVSVLIAGKDHFSHLRGQKLNQNQIIGACYLLLFIFIMLAPSLFGSSPIGMFFARFGLNGSIFIILGLLGILKIKGQYVFSFQEMAKNINWDMVLMFTATMPVSHAMSDPEVGVMTFVVELMEPIFANMSPLIFSIVFLVLAGLVTQVAHNLVLGALMTPILCSFCLQFGVDPVMLLILLNLALSVAIATPGGSAPGALVYLNTEWISIKEAYTYSAAAVVVCLVVLIAIGMPVVHVFF